ncbi:unnamed protein product [Spirodela intermedia]|uniref:Uncharacterized protein n=1 Tax=Spirodela intermedia TaxID=51605 RepID=A0A7I8KX29_SPIIN|nr:unnamed protein product [Spirodela intermedia]
MAASCAAASLSSSSSSFSPVSSSSPIVFDNLAAPSLWQSCRRLPLSCHTTRRASPLLRLHVSRLSLGRCAASAGPQPPPPEGPFPEESNRTGGGLLEAFSRSQDVLRVFFGVLFWMSLFFWSCAWDGRSSIGPNKRS